MTFLKSAGPRSRPAQEMEFVQEKQEAELGSSLEPLETFFYTHPFESSAEPMLIKVMGPYPGTAFKRDGPLTLN